MNVISVITPVYRPVREQLTAAYESLRAQELPDGWTWEWLLQDDGDAGTAREYIGMSALTKFPGAGLK
jgi:glycosyltransferase involved in cell wall biosynthesis